MPLLPLTYVSTSPSSMRGSLPECCPILFCVHDVQKGAWNTVDIHLTCAEHALSPNILSWERMKRHDPIRIPSTSALTVLTQGTVPRTQKCSHPATISTLLHHPTNRKWLENEPSHFWFCLQHLPVSLFHPLSLLFCFQHHLLHALLKLELREIY